MVEAYIQIFEQVCLAFVPLIIPVIGIYLVVNLAGGLLTSGK